MSSLPPPVRRAVVSQQTKSFTSSRGTPRANFRVGIYGPEGVGKTDCIRTCPGIEILNVENAKEFDDTTYIRGVHVANDYAASWANLRSWVQSLGAGIWGIDSITRAEDWCAAYVLKNKKSNEGLKAQDSIEDWKYRAGLTFVTDEFRRFLGDIDNAYMRGASFAMIAHDRICKFSNPDGSNYIRHEPRLINEDKASNMLQWVQFLDDLLFIDLDKNVEKGKVVGSGSRTIYFDTAANRISKSRSWPLDPMELVKGDPKLWNTIGIV